MANFEIAETLREIPPYAVARKVLETEPGAFLACKRAGFAVGFPLLGLHQRRECPLSEVKRTRWRTSQNVCL